MICTLFSAKVNIVITDNNTEYMDSGFRAYLDSNAIIHQTNCVYTSEQNEIAEKKKTHIGGK